MSWDVSQDEAEEELAQPYYHTLDSFVREYLLPNRRAMLSTGNSEPYWCASWWLHADAVTRMMALWQSWEVARADPPPAMSLWWRDQADVHMDVLTSASTTPFRRCGDGHQELPVWPAEPVPEGMFNDWETPPHEQMTRR